MPDPAQRRLRRLPIYLLMDCSASMSGEALVALRQGLMLLISDLRQEPQAVQTAWVRGITFGGVPRVATGFNSLPRFEVPELHAKGGSPLGSALRLLDRSITHDYKATSAAGAGDFLPLVFIFSDGCATDSWQSAVRSLRQRRVGRPARTVVVACGQEYHESALKELSDAILYLEDLAAGDFRRSTVWRSPDA